MSAVIESTERFPGVPTIPAADLVELRAEQDAAIEIAAKFFPFPLSPNERQGLLTAYQLGRLDAIRFANVTLKRVRK